MNNYSVLPEYCQYGYLVGTIATLISNSINQEASQWFLNAYSLHCARFNLEGLAQLNLIKNFIGYVLSSLSVKLNVLFNHELMALNNSDMLPFEHWISMFEQYILPIIKNNIEHILEVK